METSLDLSRWRETPNGVGYRRRTIVTTGLRHLARTRFFKILLIVAWIGSVLIAGAGFFFTQLVASGGWLDDYAANFGPRAEALVTALGGLMVLYPDICIHGLFTLIFWLHSFMGLFLSLVAMTVLVPQLIAQDRASNALTIYLSRPLTSTDYLLGKLGIIAGVLVLLWTGPLLAGWGLSMLLAPDRDFIEYSFLPLLRALLFNGIGLVAIATIALGVSTLTRKARGATAMWLALWLIMWVVASMPDTPIWLRRASFFHDLSEVRKNVFHLDEALTDAGTELPILNQSIARNLTTSGQAAAAKDFDGALAGLAALALVSSTVFLRKLKPE